MKVIGFIPARLDSRRLPGKVLLDIDGKPMLQHVWEQACRSRLDRVIIATDSEEVYQTAKNFGAEAEMTASSHNSGTERIAELAKRIQADFYMNIQGDEPLISPELIDLLAAEWIKDPSREVVSAANPDCSEDEFYSPHVVKAVLDQHQDAMYFSRAPIPFRRLMNEKPHAMKHIGIYGYTSQSLQIFSSSPPGQLEQWENLEQLRFLEKGIKIRMVLTQYQSIGVDTLEDLHRVKNLIEKRLHESKERQR